MNNLGRPNTIDNRKAPPASSVNQVPHLRAPIADDYSVGSNHSVGSYIPVGSDIDRIFDSDSDISFRSKTSVGSDIDRIIGRIFDSDSDISFRSKTSVDSDINCIFDSNTGGGEVHNIECTDTKETIPTQAVAIPQNAIRSGSKRNTPEDKDKYKNNQSFILGQTEHNSDDGGGKMSPNEPASMKRK